MERTVGRGHDINVASLGLDDVDLLACVVVVGQVCVDVGMLCSDEGSERSGGGCARGSHGPEGDARSPVEGMELAIDGCDEDDVEELEVAMSGERTWIVAAEDVDLGGEVFDRTRAEGEDFCKTYPRRYK